MHSFLIAVLLSAGPTLTLDQALEAAQAQNLDLQVAQARFAQAQTLTRKAWALYLPQLSATGSYTYNNVEAKFRQPSGYAIRDVGMPTTTDPSLPGTQTNLALVPTGFAEAVIQAQNALSLSLQATQQIVNLPAIWNIKNAGLAVDAQEQSLEVLRREVLFGVAQAYYGVASLKELNRIQEQLVANARAHEADAKRRYEAGALTKLSYTRAELDRSRLEQDLERAKGSLASATLALAALLDRPADFEVVTPPAPAVVDGQPAALVDEALAKRVELKASRLSQELADSTKTQVWLKFLPTVGVTGRYTVANATGFTGRNDSWLVQFGLTWVLWDGGIREAELREASAKQTEMGLAVRQTERKVRDDVEKARIDLQSAQAALLKAQDGAVLARESLALAQDSFRAGAATELDVTDASTALASAEQSLIGETLNAQLAGVRLLKALGRFSAR